MASRQPLRICREAGRSCAMGGRSYCSSLLHFNTHISRPTSKFNVRSASTRRRSNNNNNNSNTLASYLSFSAPVLEALTSGKPVVALESTIISHGMPFPQNVETALSVENDVRSGGAEPATIAIMDGKICIGLDSLTLERLGKAGSKARKVSRRDFASVLSDPAQMGATTVAGTMIAAHAAMIDVFVTGGIGGVHRGAEETFDISADLTELSRTPVAVICAGVKSILDIPKTLEYLETQGVPVISYKTADFPAFFSPTSGVKASERADSALRVAQILHASKRVGLSNGCVVAVPCPSPAVGAQIEAAITQALQESIQQNIAGKDVTPFLLARVAKLTQGESLRANIALIRHNASVGAAIAVELAKLRKSEETGVVGMAEGGGGGGGGGSGKQIKKKEKQQQQENEAGVVKESRKRSHLLSTPTSSADLSAMTSLKLAQTTLPKVSESRRSMSTQCAQVPQYSGSSVVVVGGAVVDILCRPSPRYPFTPKTSNPGIVTQSYGGVGRNIAEIISRLLPSQASSPTCSSSSSSSLLLSPPSSIIIIPSTVLVTSISPTTGSAMKQYCESVGITILNAAHQANASSQIAPDKADGGNTDGTASYVAMLDDKGELVAAVADMTAFDSITPETLKGAQTGVPIAHMHNSTMSQTCLSFEDFVSHHCVFLVSDANIPSASIKYLAHLTARLPSSSASSSSSSSSSIPFLFEPISVAKSVKIVEADALHLTTIIKPNQFEIIEMAQAIRLRLGLPPLPVHDDEHAIDTQEEGDTENDSDARVGRNDLLLTEKKKLKSQKRKPDPVQPTTVISESYSIARNTSTSGDLSSPSAFTWKRETEDERIKQDQKQLLEDAEEEEADDNRNEENSPDFNYVLLAAAQTVLAAMVRPGGLSVPLSPAALEIGLKGVDTPLGIQIVREAGVPNFHRRENHSSEERMGTSPPSPQQQQQQQQQTVVISETNNDTGALIDGRKHVIVTLGRHGALWLSCVPLLGSSSSNSSNSRSSNTPSQQHHHIISRADLAMVLPFFTAAQHPAVGFDFKHIPAAELSAKAVKKVTGAGDSLVGALVAALVGDRIKQSGTTSTASSDSQQKKNLMAESLRAGMAAAALAVQYDASSSMTSLAAGGGKSGSVPSITPATLAATIATIPMIDDEYS